MRYIAPENDANQFRNQFSFLPAGTQREHDFSRGRPMTGRSLLLTVVCVAAFGLIVFLTVWYTSDCRSPHKSVSIGGVVLLAGCGGAR
jgi:hypothetical protein